MDLVHRLRDLLHCIKCQITSKISPLSKQINFCLLFTLRSLEFRLSVNKNIIPKAFLVGCSNQKPQSHNSSSSTSSKPVNKNIIPKAPKPNIHKKYPCLTLMTIPSQFCGTWYRSDPFSKKARKLVITNHLINDSVLYKKIDKFKLNHNSAKQNKEYAGDIHSAIFRDAKTALKYRKYVFSKVN